MLILDIFVRFVFLPIILLIILTEALPAMASDYVTMFKEYFVPEKKKKQVFTLGEIKEFLENLLIPDKDKEKLESFIIREFNPKPIKKLDKLVQFIKSSIFNDKNKIQNRDGEFWELAEVFNDYIKKRC